MTRPTGLVARALVVGVRHASRAQHLQLRDRPVVRIIVRRQTHSEEPRRASPRSDISAAPREAIRTRRRTRARRCHRSTAAPTSRHLREASITRARGKSSTKGPEHEIDSSHRPNCAEIDFNGGALGLWAGFPPCQAILVDHRRDRVGVDGRVYLRDRERPWQPRGWAVPAAR